MTQGVSSLLVFHVGDDGVAELEDGCGTLASNKLSILLHEGTRAGGADEFALEAGITGGTLAVEQAEATEDEGSGTDGSNGTAKVGVVTDALAEVIASGEIRGAGHSAWQDKKFGIEEIDVLKKGIGLHADAVGTRDSTIASNGNDLQVEACTANDVGGSESFQLLGASGKE